MRYKPNIYKLCMLLQNVLWNYNPVKECIWVLLVDKTLNLHFFQHSKMPNFLIKKHTHITRTCVVNISLITSWQKVHLKGQNLVYFLTSCKVMIRSLFYMTLYVLKIINKWFPDLIVIQASLIKIWCNKYIFQCIKETWHTHYYGSQNICSLVAPREPETYK